MSDERGYGSQLDNPDVRKHVTLEIEMENARQRLRETKASFKRIAWRTAAAFFASVIINCAIKGANTSIAEALIHGTVLSILVNVTAIIDIMSSWRGIKTAKKDLRSWDLLRADYKNEINEGKKDWRGE